MTTAVLSPLAVGSIRLYQRYISPYKGFRCAHRAVAAKWSCSEYGRRVFAKHSIATAQALLKRRFAACRRSYELYLAKRHAAATAAMTSATQTQAEDEKKKRTWKDRAADYCDPSVCECLPYVWRGGRSVAGQAGDCATSAACDGIGSCG